MARTMGAAYERDGLSWPLADRLLFLDALGRLDPEGGDPRLEMDRWVAVREAEPSRAGALSPFRAFAKWPVTVQEFRAFVDAPDYLAGEYWHSPYFGVEFPSLSQTYHILEMQDRASSALRTQLRHPNRPVVGVGIGAAVAYCAWATSRRSDGALIRLPYFREWERFFRGRLRHYAQQGRETGATTGEPVANWQYAVGHPTPVGAFPPQELGAWDLIGNVWEMTLPQPSSAVRDHRSADGLDCMLVGWSYAGPDSSDFSISVPLGVLSSGHNIIGFRAVMA